MSPSLQSQTWALQLDQRGQLEVDPCSGRYARAWLESAGNNTRYAWFQLHEADGAPVGPPTRLSRTVHDGRELRMRYGGGAFRVLWSSSPSRRTCSAECADSILYAAVDPKGSVLTEQTTVLFDADGRSSLGNAAVQAELGDIAFAVTRYGASRSDEVVVIDADGALRFRWDAPGFTRLAWAGELLLTASTDRNLGQTTLRTTDLKGNALAHRLLQRTDTTFLGFVPSDDGSVLAALGARGAGPTLEALEPKTLAALSRLRVELLGYGDWGANRELPVAARADAIYFAGSIQRDGVLQHELVKLDSGGFVVARRSYGTGGSRPLETQLSLSGGRARVSWTEAGAVVRHKLEVFDAP